MQCSAHRGALSVSTTTTIAILTAAELDAVVPNGDPAALLQATALLTLMVGGILMLAALLRLGFIANFISEPVLIGFKAGIATVIVVDQLPKVLGIHFTKGSFLHNVQAIGAGLADVSMPPLVRRRAHDPRARRHRETPAAVAGTADRGGARNCRRRLARRRRERPRTGRRDSRRAARFQRAGSGVSRRQLWPGALGIALMSFTETAAVAPRVRAQR